MRKVALMFVVCIMAISTAVLAHDPVDEIWTAVQFPAGNEPTIDGDCSDWDAVIPGDEYWLLGADFYDSDLTRGEMNPSDLTITTRMGWSASVDGSSHFYYCQSVFDDVHVIDRADSYDWYDDDGAEHMWVALHMGEQELRDHREAEGINPQWGVNFAVPKSSTGDTWMVVSPCNACDWSVNHNEQHSLEWSFTGEEYGESTYHYEHQMRMLDFYPSGLDYSEIGNYSEHVWKTVEEGTIMHTTWRNNDDDSEEDGGGPTDRWNTGVLGIGGFGMGDTYLEELRDDLPWDDMMTSVESQSWGRIKSQF